MSDDFYIGYEPNMPDSLASHTRTTARRVMVFAVLLSGALVIVQGRFAPSIFEFGRVRVVEGRVIEHPYPALEVDVRAAGSGMTTTYWLVGQGKHGAADLVKGRDGQHVRLSGSLIQRDGDAMLEIAPDGIVTIDSSRLTLGDPIRSQGRVVLEGEIVDSKCHLGVMKPGEGPTHRDCAVRCLLGSIPPMFVPHDRSLGRFAIVGPDGRAFIGDLEGRAGRPVAIRGELLQRGTKRFLSAASADIRILN